jgi:hypothetical protein
MVVDRDQLYRLGWQRQRQRLITVLHVTLARQPVWVRPATISQTALTTVAGRRGPWPAGTEENRVPRPAGAGC